MNYQENKSVSYSPEAAAQSFIQKVYQWMAMGLALTGFVAFITANNLGLMRFLVHGGMWIVAIVELILVIWLTTSIARQRISPQAAVLGFFTYAVLNGVFLSGIFLVYTHASIATTFFITAMTFGGVSVYGWMTKQDLSSVGSFCGMALWGIIIASIVNFFFRSPAFDWVVSYLGVAVFIGLTAWDMQKLKRIQYSGLPTTEQMAVWGALMLYLDFINMFLFLLRIFSRRN